MPRTAPALHGRTHDARGEAWTPTRPARTRPVDGDAAPAVEEPRRTAARPRDNGNARGEAWTIFCLGQGVEETGDLGRAVRGLERSRRLFCRMRDVYGPACAPRHSARVTRDQRAAQTGSPRNSGSARQVLVDARSGFHGIGVTHGEAWSRLGLAVVDAGHTPRPAGAGTVRRGGSPVRLVRRPARRPTGPARKGPATGVRPVGVRPAGVRPVKAA